MDSRLLDVLVCPICKGPLQHLRTGAEGELACRRDALAYPIRDGIPVMLVDVARKYDPETETP